MQDLFYNYFIEHMFAFYSILYYNTTNKEGCYEHAAYLYRH